MRGKLPPSLTADERAVEDEKLRKDQLARQRQAEYKRRDRVLLNRYPDPASHAARTRLRAVAAWTTPSWPARPAWPT